MVLYIYLKNHKLADPDLKEGCHLGAMFGRYRGRMGLERVVTGSKPAQVMAKPELQSPIECLPHCVKSPSNLLSIKYVSSVHHAIGLCLVAGQTQNNHQQIPIECQCENEDRKAWKRKILPSALTTQWRRKDREMFHH